jgi:hypothetical protein
MPSVKLSPTTEIKNPQQQDEITTFIFSTPTEPNRELIDSMELAAKLGDIPFTEPNCQLLYSIEPEFRDSMDLANKLGDIATYFTLVNKFLDLELAFKFIDDATSTEIVTENGTESTEQPHTVHLP